MIVRPLKWLPLLTLALMLQACDKKSGAGKPAAAPRSGQSSAQKAAQDSDEEKADKKESGDEDLVPPPDKAGYAPVD